MPFAAVHIANSIQKALDSLLGFIPNILDPARGLRDRQSDQDGRGQAA
jgi:hypothetical protein